MVGDPNGSNVNDFALSMMGIKTGRNITLRRDEEIIAKDLVTWLRRVCLTEVIAVRQRTFAVVVGAKTSDVGLQCLPAIKRYAMLKRHAREQRWRCSLWVCHNWGPPANA